MRIPGVLGAAAVASAVAVAVAGPASAAESLSASKTSGLAAAGEQITVGGTGFAADKSLMLINCDLSTQRGEGCDMGATVSVKTDAKGAFSAAFTAKGAYGTTDCTKVSCGVVVYDMATHTLPARLKLSFGKPASSATPTPSKPSTTKPSTTKPETKPATAQPGTSNSAAPAAGSTTPAKPAGEELAATGGNDGILPLAAGGAAVLALGIGVVAATRRRGNRTA